MWVHIATIAAFMIVTLLVQGGSHFILNKAHYAAISFLRPDPIMPLGLLVMVLQGAVMSVVLQSWRGAEVQVWHGLQVSLLFGLFLGSYIALTEPAKYAAPDVLAWIRVEAPMTIVQFTLFGGILGWIHQRVAV